MAMFSDYFEASVNFNTEIRREKFIILISILYPIYSILITGHSTGGARSGQRAPARVQILGAQFTPRAIY